MGNIALNFVPLVEQDKKQKIYRKIVLDSSQPRQERDYRVNLPKDEGDQEDWELFDICTTERDGYEEFTCEFSLNHILTVHLIYLKFRDLAEKSNALEIDHETKSKIASKQVRFREEEFPEGSIEIVVTPYYLKTQRLFGFVIEHKFSLRHDQEFNRKIQMLSLSLDKSGKSNTFFYRDKREKIQNFIDGQLLRLVEGTDIEIEPNFAVLRTGSLDVKTYLVGDNNESRSQFVGIVNSGPYKRLHDQAQFLFVFNEKTRSLAREIYSGLVGKLFPGQFSGLESMFSLSMNRDVVEHKLVENFDSNAIQDIGRQVEQIKSNNPNKKIMIVAVLPKGSKGSQATFDAYGHLKLMALARNAYCQVITEDTFYRRDQLKWAISNIGLQIFSKLGGTPWLLKPASNNCLMFGLGSVRETRNETTTRHSAYTVCVDSTGDFKYVKPLTSSPSEHTYLENLETRLQEVLSAELSHNHQSLVLHLPHKISWKEIRAIKKVASSVREESDIEVIVIRINTNHKFLGFSKHNTCVPHESEFVQLSTNEFLVWTEGLQYGKEVLHKRVSEPLYIEFIQSPQNWETKRRCLQDILNLSGANWRGFNSKARPISILYSRLIAKFIEEFTRLDTNIDTRLVQAESKAPWFL